MDQIVYEAKDLLNQPSKCFSLSGITEDGKLVDIQFSFNQFKNISEVLPDHSHQWVVLGKDRFHEFGINLNSAAVRFNDQALVEMRSRNVFLDCVMLENRVKDYVNHPDFSTDDKSRKETMKKFIDYILRQIKKKMYQ